MLTVRKSSWFDRVYELSHRFRGEKTDNDVNLCSYFWTIVLKAPLIFTRSIWLGLLLGIINASFISDALMEDWVGFIIIVIVISLINIVAFLILLSLLPNSTLDKIGENRALQLTGEVIGNTAELTAEVYRGFKNRFCPIVRRAEK